MDLKEFRLIKDGTCFLFSNNYQIIKVVMFMVYSKSPQLKSFITEKLSTLSTLHSCRKSLSGEEAVNLTREFKFFTEKIFSEDLERKKFHNAVEFLDRLINKLLSESCCLEDQFIFPILRSSYPEVFCKKVFFKILQNSQENTSVRETLWHRCYPANFSKFQRTPF